MRRPVCAVCLAFAAAVGLLQGIGKPPLPSYGEAKGQTVTVTGEVCRKETELSKFYGEQQVLYLKDISSVQFQNKDWKTEYTEGVLCRVPKDAEGIGCVKTGSCVTVRGELDAFERSRVPGGFDEAKYYQIQGYSFEMKKAQVLEAGESYDKIGEALFCFRRHIAGIFEQTLTAKDASVLKAMLLGDKKGLDRDTEKLYQEAAISHILCISGLHITFLGMGLYRLCKRTFLPKYGSVFLCIAVMVLYGRMTGMGSSAARAVFMFALTLLAQLLGRSYDMLTALAISAVWILAEQPLYIRHSGFLLSFGAVIGLGLITPVLQHHNKRFRNLAGGLGVFFATLPVLIQCFYEVAPYSLFLNLLVIPLSVVLLPAGLCIPALFWICPPLAKLPAFLCHVILLCYEAGGRASLAFPGSRLSVGHVRTEQIVFYYLALAGLLVLTEYAKGRLSGRFKAVLLLGAVTVLTMRPEAGGMKVVMLDVGQGDGILIRCGKTDIFVDGGSSSVKDVGEWRILPALKYYGCRELDYILLSHADEDHINGVTALLREGDIRCRVLGVPAVTQKERVLEMESEILQPVFSGKSRPPLVCRMKSGDKIREDGFEITILHPAENVEYRDKNSTSMAFLLSGGGVSFLFTGDLPGEEEALVLEEMKRLGFMIEKREGAASPPVILKAAHHGSDSSTTEEWLNAFQPVLTLISCGENNSYGHPGEEMLERLEECKSSVLITAEHGSFAVTAEDGEITLQNEF